MSQREVSEKDVLDFYLLSLVDNYEAGPKTDKWLKIEGTTVEEFEAARKFTASQRAQGFLIPSIFGDSYRLTAKGYAKYKPLAEAMAALGGR